MRRVVLFDIDAADRAYYSRAFKNVFGIELNTTGDSLNEETAKKYKDAEVVSVSPNSYVSKQVLALLPNLEFIAARSWEYNHIDTAAAATAKVLVSRLSNTNPTAVAEYALALIFALARHITPAVRHVISGAVAYDDLRGIQLESKTLGLVGSDEVSDALVARARALDMLAVQALSDGSQRQAKAVSLDELFDTADIISLHVPAKGRAKHLIDADAIAQMKQGVMLVNVSDGGLVDTQALVDGLYSGQIGAAGLDSIEGEGLLAFDAALKKHRSAPLQDLRLRAEMRALSRMDNVILTPNQGFNTAESTTLVREDTVENIKSYLMHEPRNTVS